MSRVGLLAAALFVVQPSSSTLTLEIRVFDGAVDVTSECRVNVHRAGERGQPVGQIPVGAARSTMQVPAGLYDAQAVREREGRVVNIRWAARLVVMPYPDEGGHHLEVINLAAGYGALQIRSASPAGLRLALFPSGDRAVSARLSEGPGYTLFVVPAGQYDVRATRGSAAAWYNAVDVPLDRTRLWIAP